MNVKAVFDDLNDVIGLDLMKTIYFSLLVPGLVFGGLFALLYFEGEEHLAEREILFMAHVLAIQ